MLRWRKVFPDRGHLRNQQSCLAERKTTWQGAVGLTLSREWNMLRWGNGKWTRASGVQLVSLWRDFVVLIL